VGIGGVAGVDTTAYAMGCVERWPAFKNVILVLKILLVQRGYDKPFTGGIGSYKLYVLLAALLESVGGGEVSESESENESANANVEAPHSCYPTTY